MVMNQCVRKTDLSVFTLSTPSCPEYKKKLLLPSGIKKPWVLLCMGKLERKRGSELEPGPLWWRSMYGEKRGNGLWRQRPLNAFVREGEKETVLTERLICLQIIVIVNWSSGQIFNDLSSGPHPPLGTLSFYIFHMDEISISSGHRSPKQNHYSVYASMSLKLCSSGMPQ